MRKSVRLPAPLGLEPQSYPQSSTLGDTIRITDILIFENMSYFIILYDFE